MIWTISVPVWGERYWRIFAECAWPALRVAVTKLDARVRFVLHTNALDKARALLADSDLEIRPVGDNPTYVELQRGHADVLRTTPDGSPVVLLNADLIVSANLLTRCAEHLANGKQAVVLLGIRTPLGNERPPIGQPPRQLLLWAWTHRHQIIRDLEWESGRSMLPTNLFFARGGSVVARGFHLHPVMVVKRADVSFKSTIDGDLLDCYARESIHVVTDPDDCAMCEVSPPDRRFPVRTAPFSPPLVAASMQGRASATHLWLFAEHRIGVVGPVVDCGDEEIARRIVELMTKQPPAPPSRLARPRRR